MTSSLVDRVGRFLRQPSFVVITRLADSMPGRPVQIARFFELRLDTPRIRSVRASCTLRAGVPADGEAMSRLESKPVSVFDRRFAEGEKCAVALDGDEIVGYAWFSDQPGHVEARFRYDVPIPEDAIYGYDAFIKPEYRLRGVWLQLQKYLWEAAHEMGRRSVLTLVDYGNDASLKSHLRLGYRVVRIVTFIRIGWHRWFLYANRSPGVYLQSTRPRPAGAPRRPRRVLPGGRFRDATGRMRRTRLRVETVTDAGALDAYRAAWMELSARAPGAVLFNSHSWVRAWLSAFWQHRPISFRMVYEGDDLVGVVPLVLDSEGEFWCRDSLVIPAHAETPRIESLTDGRDAEVVAALLKDEAGPGHAVRLAFKNLPSDAPVFEYLPSLAQANQMRFVAKADPTEEVPRPPSGDQPEERLNLGMRRKRRAFERVWGRQWRVLSQPRELEEALRAMNEVERGSGEEDADSPPAAFATTGDFYYELLSRLALDGALRLYLLQADDRTIAYVLGAVHNDVLYGLRTSSRPEAASMSPTTVLLSYVLEDAFAKGHRFLDSPGVADDGKTHLGTACGDTQSVCLASRGVLRCDACHLIEMQAKPAVREAVPKLGRGAR